MGEKDNIFSNPRFRNKKLNTKSSNLGHLQRGIVYMLDLAFGNGKEFIESQIKKKKKLEPWIDKQGISIKLSGYHTMDPKLCFLLAVCKRRLEKRMKS